MRVDSGDSGDNEIDFDLNLAPIIDCFTVLITFLLVSASYLSIQILEASIASIEVAPEQSPVPPKGVSLQVLAAVDGGYEISISGEENRKIAIQAAPGALTKLEGELKEIRSKWKETKTLTVLGEDGVEYKNIVQVIEKARTRFETILMGGF